MPRVSVDRSTHEFYQRLTKSEGKSKSVFSTMKDVFVLCFSLGAANGVRKALNDKVDVFDVDVFRPDEWTAIEAVYLAESKDVRVLDSSADLNEVNSRVLESAEEYANAGASILRDGYDFKRPAVKISYMILEAVEA